MIHLGRCLGVSPRRELDCFLLIELVAHPNVEVARDDCDVFILWMMMGGEFIPGRHL